MSCPVDFRLVFHPRLSRSYEFSQVLLASADSDGKLQLLTSGWEGALGYGRAEFREKTLLNLMWCNKRDVAAAVAAILDKLNLRPVNLRLRCRNGLGKCFRLHRQYDEQEDRMYILAEETAEAPTHAIPGAERRTSARQA